MSKDQSDVSCDGEASCSSFDSFNGSLETPTMEKLAEEEEKLKIENEKIAALEESRYSAPITPEDSEESIQSYDDVALRTEAKLKEQKYRRLMHLLKHSQAYAVILKSRLKEEEAKAKKGYKKGKSAINGVLNEKDIKDNTVEVRQENLESTVEEDYFKETRTTSLGFTVSTRQPLLLEGAQMRDYQLKGLEWMVNLFNNGVNGILGDEMGLGKTIQVISFICYLLEHDIKGPFLVIAPLSTITNWMSEFKKFAPKVPVIVYHGSGSRRQELQKRLLQTAKLDKKKVHYVVLTSYQVPLFDRKFMSKINWFYVIVDEGHRIKNHQSQLARVLREFKTFGRLLLTGTPLQNDLSELWSLLNYLLPEVFNSLEVFESWFDIKSLENNASGFMKEKSNLDFVFTLQEILQPFLLRREKKDVNLQLPAKKEIIIHCPLTQTQKKLYEAVIDRSIECLLNLEKEKEIDLNAPLPKRRCFLNSPYGKKTESMTTPKKKQETPKRVEQEERYFNHIRMQNPQMALRQIVNHPYLIQFPLKEGTEDYKIDESLIQASGKLLVLDAMLAKLKAKGHRVFALSYFKVMLDLLEEYAILRGYKYCRFDGDSDIDDRTDEIARFSQDSDIFIFFSTLRAGGLGINLTSADTVILYDSDWNPQINLQAQDRCHRIGQTKPVIVYRLCAIGTIDERIIERGNAKRRLEKMILQKGKFTSTPKSASTSAVKLNFHDLQQLKKMLESMDHDVVIHSNGFVFTDEELDALLDRTEMTSTETEEMDGKGFKLLNYEK